MRNNSIYRISFYPPYFFSVCLPLFIRHIAAMLLRKTSSKTMQTVTKYLKELSGVRSDNSPNSYK